MKNQTLMVIAAVVIVLGGGAFLFSQSQQSPDAMVDKSETFVGSETVVGDDKLMQDNSQQDAQMSERYVAYSQEAFAQASNQKRVLFFFASWCPTCVPFDAELSTRTNEIPKGVMVFKTNYDTETALKQKYGITYQHTFVIVDSAGNEVAKWNGGTMDEFFARISL